MLRSVAMVLLDAADPPLHVAKQCKYVSEARIFLAGSSRTSSGGGAGFDLWAKLADIWFAMFTVTFTLTRNVMFPYVVWSAWVETGYYWRKHSYQGVFSPTESVGTTISKALFLDLGSILVPKTSPK